MKKLTILFVSMGILLLPSFAHAQENNHDSGFLLRFHLGGGQGSFTGEDSSGKIEYEGRAGLFNLQLGGFVAPNWALHGGISVISADDTDIEIDGNSAGISDASYGVGNLALGFSYYIMPINIYISPELRFRGRAKTEYKVSDTDVEYTYKSGRGFGLTVGKEWFVSSNWGLGVALSYYKDTLDGHKVKTGGVEIDSDLDGDHSYFGIAFSATYN